MTRLTITLAVLMTLAAGALALDPAPLNMSYQGMLEVHGVAHHDPDGSNTRFKFAILCGGEYAWANDDWSYPVAEPTTAVGGIPVVDGRFSVVLGDNPGPLDMESISPQALEGCADAMLRVWVESPPGSGFEQLPDQKLTSVPFALHAAFADNADNGFHVYRGTLTGNLIDGVDLVSEQHGARLNWDPASNVLELEQNGASSVRLDGAGSGLGLGDWTARQDEEGYFALSHGGVGTALKVDGDGHLWVPGTIAFGTTGTTAPLGLIRHTGSDVEAYADGAWRSLTAGDGSGGWVENGADVGRPGGRVGIGTSQPEADLHVVSDGPATLHLQADRDNSGESDHPTLRLSQDGNLIAGELGFAEGSNVLELRRIDQADTLFVEIRDVEFAQRRPGWRPGRRRRARARRRWQRGAHRAWTVRVLDPRRAERE